MKGLITAFMLVILVGSSVIVPLPQRGVKEGVLDPLSDKELMLN